jgi:hypothetical protein
MRPVLTGEQKRYGAAKERFLKPALIKFIETEFPQIGGPLVVKLFVEKIMEKIDQIAPLKERVKPGQMVWNNLDEKTRADHPKRKTKSVLLTIVTREEVEKLEKGVKHNELMPERIARLCREAKEQETLLSMRDLGLIFGKDGSSISHYRINYEKSQKTVLPHTGSLHDQGTTLTHKEIICRKVKQEGKDPSLVAKETNHSQRSVDNYLQGYERVKALSEMGKSPNEISFLTGMGPRLINQYKNLIHDFGDFPENPNPIT